MSTTRPAPVQFESPIFIPPSARLSPLARAALEAGVEPRDVQAYVSCSYRLPLGTVEVCP